MFSEEDIVFSYTTKMAVEDGVLIPIPGIISGVLAIKYPVYFNPTCSVFNKMAEKTGKNDVSPE